jgi:hypothetical protein
VHALLAELLDQAARIAEHAADRGNVLPHHEHAQVVDHRARHGRSDRLLI